MIDAGAVIAATAGGAPSIVIKATVVLVLSAVIASMTKRASAAKRHLLWLGALFSCAALVLVAPVARRIVLPVPSFVPATLSASIGAEVGRGHSRRPGNAATPATRSVIQIGRVVELTGMQAPIAPRQLSDLATTALLLWTCGVLFVVGRFAFAYARVHAIARRSRELNELRWQASLARVSNRRDIILRVGDTLSSPFTFGVVRPTIVLPRDAIDWSDERRETVLRHEIAHIERGDVATQTAGFLVCALFWFHPLAWLALAQLRYESERAADDRVISDGWSSIAYAAHLVELARVAHEDSRVPPGAVAIVRPPLEQRIRAILDETRSRSGVAARTRVAGLCTVVAVVLPLSGVELTHVVRPQVVAPQRPAVERVAAPPIDAQRGAGAPSVTSKNAQSPRSHRAPIRVAARDSVRTEAVAPVSPLRLGEHPDLSGVWRFAQDASADSGTSTGPTLTIAQTPTTISEHVRRRAMDEFGRDKGVLDASLDLEDGSPARATFAVNGVTARRTMFGMSWDGDTLMMRSAQLGRGTISGAIERLWLTADGRGLVAHTAPFGYQVNSERTDTLWRSR